MQAAYLRRIGHGLPPYLQYDAPTTAQDPQTWRQLYTPSQHILERERVNHSVRNAILEYLAKIRTVINPPRPQNLHRLKALMMQRLQNAGLPIPRLVVSADREKLCSFAQHMQTQQCGVVHKPLAGIYKTKLWNPKPDTNNQDHQPLRPAFLQHFIKGHTLRCFALEGRLLSAAKIIHQDTVDSSVSQTGIEVCDLDLQARTAVEQTAQCLGLQFCGLDLMLDEHTNHCFVIDCNLSPMFVNYGKLSGCDIAGYLADTLIQHAKPDAYRQMPALDLLAQAKAILSHDADIAQLLNIKKHRKL
jgi:glutathione synthase/RimK-type ligase-like ATP-grasp enzyme